MTTKARKGKRRPSGRVAEPLRDPRHLRIFVASPGDVATERDIVTLIGTELQRTIGVAGKAPLVHLEVVRWETHAWPDFGEDAQDVVNREIGEYDIFVGIMWRRFGTPTGRADSGTEEEFNRAFDCFKLFRRPKIMMYFRREPFYPTADDLGQFAKVLAFKKRLAETGGLYWEYTDTLEFERFVREHLIKQVLALTSALTRE